MSDYGPCKMCGATSQQFLIPVWEDPATYRAKKPDYLGCTECHTMHEVETDGN